MRGIRCVAPLALALALLSSTLPSLCAAEPAGAAAAPTTSTTASAAASTTRLAIRAGRVFPVDAPPIDDGVVLVENGRIIAVGSAATTPLPSGVTVLNEPSAWLVPGFIDLHCHIAGTDINDMIYPTNTDLSVLDQIVPGSEDLLDAVAGGVTTALFIPGSGTNLGGFGALIKTTGRDLDEMILRFPGAMKIAQAGNPERRSGELGRGRMGMNWNLRETLEEGRRYHETWTTFESGQASVAPARLQRLELMRGLFRGDFPILVHTQQAPVFLSSIRMLHDEFKLWVVFSHSELDAYINAPLAAERDLFINVGPRSLHQDPNSGEILGLAERYRRDGVKHISVNTDSPVVAEQEFPLQAALAVRYGLPWDLGLRALTLEPAIAIGIADRAGSITPGKDADLVLWTGDPLDPRSHVLVTISGGRIALDQRVAGERRW